MPQIFRPKANTVSRITILALVLLVIGTLWLLAEINNSPYVTQVRVVRGQPVPFSHEHHVGGLGIDCRYCHQSVEKSSFAGLPATSTCMQCHSHVWADSPVLAPVRDSFRTGKRIPWVRVSDVPDFVYFNHAIHVKKGIGCVSCHGQVDRMPLMWKEHTFNMGWCLDCHRHPDDKLAREYGIQKRVECYACHR